MSFLYETCTEIFKSKKKRVCNSLSNGSQCYTHIYTCTQGENNKENIVRC